MSKVYTDIFDKPRKELWKQLNKFSYLGYLGGGTALALQINHRISYDFDVFTNKPIEKTLLMKINNVFPSNRVKPLIDNSDELTVEVGEVKLTFLYYPFESISNSIKTESLPIFSVKDIAADKAYTIGRRGVWRDYYDIYSILKKKILQLRDIIKLSNQKFGSLFNEKLFLEQLTYYDDIKDFSIETTQGTSVTPQEVQKHLKARVKTYISEKLKS